MNVRVIPHTWEFNPLVKRLGREKALAQFRGKWAVDYYCPVTKKRKYESFDTEKEAKARKKELEGKDATGEYVPLHRRTWAEFVTEYREKILPGKKYKTRIIHDEAITAFERICSPNLMQTIGTHTLDGFRSKRSTEQGRKEGDAISPNTVNKHIRALRTILRVAHEWDYLPKLPKFNMATAPDVEPRAIPKAEFDSIIEAARKIDEQDRRAAGWSKGLKPEDARHRKPRVKAPGSEWWIAFLSTSYFAGLRWGELLNLRWCDVRFTAKPDLRIWNEKKSRWDFVPMTATLAERLREWMNKAPNVSDNALVFPHSCHTRTVLVEWGRIQDAAEGIERAYRFHDLRVSFCTNLVAAGVEAPTLMKLARHRDIKTTMQFYRGRTDDADRKALDRMEAAFSMMEKDQADSAKSGEGTGEGLLHSDPSDSINPCRI